tara:strand:- start:6744 stop:6941 length:198 start_codon:yes stop_codon:yes gene_type:complete
MEEHTCIECEELYDSTDGDTDERMCDECLDSIYYESLDVKGKERIKLLINEFDEWQAKLIAEQRY